MQHRPRQFIAPALQAADAAARQAVIDGYPCDETRPLLVTHVQIQLALLGQRYQIRKAALAVARMKGREARRAELEKQPFEYRPAIQQAAEIMFHNSRSNPC